MSLALHICKILRRGKAEKGSVAVKTFGKPIPNKDGITQHWDYVNVVLNKSFATIVAEVKQLISVNEQMLSVALLTGLDILQKSETAKSSNGIQMLANRNLAQGLATDKDEAVRLAAQWLPKIVFAVENEYIPDMETGILQQLLKRKKFVEELKANGMWASSAPRLVQKEEPKEDTLPEMEESTDSDDSNDVPDEDFIDDDSETVSE